MCAKIMPLESFTPEQIKALFVAYKILVGGGKSKELNLHVICMSPVRL